METKLIILVVLSLVASGCANDTSMDSGQGLVIEEFTISDNTLNPGQRANLQVTLANYNTNPIEINELEIFNEGELTVNNKQCTSEDIRAAREDLIPQLSCSWTVEAPGADFVSGFESKSTPIKLRLSYNSTFENKEPLKINYKELNNIENSGEVRKQFGNGEINVLISSNSPADSSNPGTVNFRIENSGPGRVENNYRFSYSPPNILTECPESEEPVINDKVEFTCNLNSGSTGVKNMFLTTSYKYIKSPNLDIQVVNNQ